MNKLQLLQVYWGICNQNIKNEQDDSNYYPPTMILNFCFIFFTDLFLF